jgi:hypothetical protein
MGPMGASSVEGDFGIPRFFWKSEVDMAFGLGEICGASLHFTPNVPGAKKRWRTGAGVVTCLRSRLR